MRKVAQLRLWIAGLVALAALFGVGVPAAQADDPPPIDTGDAAGDVAADAADLAPADIVDLGSLPGVTVQSATLTARPIFETTASVNLVTREALARELPRSVSDALRYQPGLWSAQSSNGQMGTPSIRGMMGNEVLLLIDGLRMNTSLTPTGPGPDWDLLDMELVDHIEVLRTPDSVIYGTDALGGVTAIYTGWPLDYTRQGGRVGGSLGGSFMAGGERQRRYKVQGQVATPRLRSVLALSFVDADDMVAGGSAGTQSPTSYSSEAGLFKLEARATRRDTVGVTFFGMHKDFDGHFLFPSRVQNTDHRRYAGILRWQHDGWTPIADTFEVRLGLAYNYRLIKRTDVFLRDEFEILSPQVDFIAHKRLGRHGLTWGITGHGEDLTAAVERTSGTISSVPDAQTTQLGVFVEDEWDVSPRLRVTAGARFDYVRVKTDPNPAKTDPLVNPNDIRIDRSDTALTGKLGVLYLLNKRVSATGNVARGYRFPNASDLAAFRQAPDEIVVGNPDLEPEWSTTVEGGLHFAFPRLRANVVGYYTWYENLIIGRPGMFNGATYADRNGNGMEDSDEGFYLRQNAGSAETAGVDIDAEVDLTEAWRLFGNFSWWHGNFTPKSFEPLGMPTNATFGVHYHPTRYLWAEAAVHWVRDFSDIDPAFYADEAFFRRDPHNAAAGTLTNDNTVPGFTTLDLRVGATLWRRVHVTVGLENVFDTNYRWYGARHDAPGATFLFNATLDL